MSPYWQGRLDSLGPFRKWLLRNILSRRISDPAKISCSPRGGTKSSFVFPLWLLRSPPTASKKQRRSSASHRTLCGSVTLRRRVSSTWQRAPREKTASACFKPAEGPRARLCSDKILTHWLYGLHWLPLVIWLYGAANFSIAA